MQKNGTVKNIDIQIQWREKKKKKIGLCEKDKERAVMELFTAETKFQEGAYVVNVTSLSYTWNNLIT